MVEISKNAQKTAIILMPIIWLAFIVIALNLTSPIVAGPPGILLIFLLSYLFISSSFFVIIMFIRMIYGMLNKKAGFSKNRALRLSLVLALAPIFLIALNTLGNIGFIEVSLVCLLISLACFYVIRRSEE